MAGYHECAERCPAGAAEPGAGRFDPGWRTSTVVALARGIVQDAAWDRMPILADALEDAGCDNPVVLAHCRRATAHDPACWVLPLILSASPPPAPAPARGRSVFVEAARRLDTPGHRPPDCVPAVLGVLIPLLGLGLAIWLVASTRVGEELPYRAVALFALGLALFCATLYYFSSLLAVLRARRAGEPARRGAAGSDERTRHPRAGNPPPPRAARPG